MEANIHMRQSAKEAELYDNLIVEIELLRGEGILKKGRSNKEGKA